MNSYSTLVETDFSEKKQAGQSDIQKISFLLSVAHEFMCVYVNIPSQNIQLMYLVKQNIIYSSAYI